MLSFIPLFLALWTVACQAPLSMARIFSRQEDWSGLPFPTLGDLPDPGFEPVSLVSLALAGRFFTTGTTWEALRKNTAPLNSSFLVFFHYWLFFLSFIEDGVDIKHSVGLCC